MSSTEAENYAGIHQKTISAR